MYTLARTRARTRARARAHARCIVERINGRRSMTRSSFEFPRNARLIRDVHPRPRSESREIDRDHVAKVCLFICRERKESGWKRMEVSSGRGVSADSSHCHRHRRRRRCRRRCPSLSALWSPDAPSLMRPIVRALTALTRIGKKYLRYLRARDRPAAHSPARARSRARTCVCVSSVRRDLHHKRTTDQTGIRSQRREARRREQDEGEGQSRVGRGGSIGTSLTAANNPRARTNI